MNHQNINREILLESANTLLPGVSTDCVILGFHKGNLKILLNKFSYYNMWMLPGGFVYKDEDVNTAARRILLDRTGLDEVFLRQFYLFGDADRTKIKENEDMLEKQGNSSLKNQNTHWLLQRFISVGYYALVDYSRVEVHTNLDEDIRWFDMDEIPVLYSDHNKIIEKAISTIRTQISSIPIGYKLLPEKFTLTQLRIIYETILDTKLDRRNFQRKILSTGLVDKLDEMHKQFGYKASTLYSFNKDKYKKAMENGFSIF